MQVGQLESLILFVSDLAAAKAFYVDGLGLPVLFEDQILVIGGEPGRVVLHCNDRGHDERGTFPAGSGVGRGGPVAVEDPDAYERDAGRKGSRWCGWSRKPRGAGSWSWRIPMAAQVVLAEMRPVTLQQMAAVRHTVGAEGAWVPASQSQGSSSHQTTLPAS